MQDYPPQHQRFDDEKIPSHITYAYKRGATIAKNDDFYVSPKNQTRKVDVLFVIASAPVKTGSLPEAGSESYVGLAIAMELAMNELSEKFPAFFHGAIRSSTRCGIWQTLQLKILIYMNIIALRMTQHVQSNALTHINFLLYHFYSAV